MTIYGDGSQTRDFVYVGDVVNNMMAAMQILKKESNVLNICSGQSVSMNELAQLIAQLMDKECIRFYQPKKSLSDSQDSYGCVKKMQRHGLICQWSLRDGLLKTIDYFKASF